MPRARRKRSHKVGNSRPGKNRRRQAAVAKNLAAGMGQEEALLEAGYSPTTARKIAYQVVRHPVIQSLLTDSCQRIMQKRNMEFDAILEPYFDGLKAPLIVKSTQLGDAQIARDPKTGEPFPDYHTRIASADRLVDLHRQQGAQGEDPKPPGPPVNIQVNFIKTPTQHPSPRVSTKPTIQAQGTGSPVPKVAFVSSKR